MPRPLRQLCIPWAVRALVARSLSPVEELLEVLMQDGEPLVRQWARGQRGKIRGCQELAVELTDLELEGGPVARTLAAAVRDAWRAFGGTPLPLLALPVGQSRLPLDERAPEEP